MKIPNPKFCLGLIIALTLIECVFTGYIGWWRNGFWSAVAHRDVHLFILYMIKFTIAALTICWVSSKNQYLRSYAGLVYRRELTHRWWKKSDMQQEVHSNTEGYQQRIQEDCFNYPLLAINLSMDLLKNLVILLTFVVIIMYQLSPKYLLYPLIYTITGTVCAKYLALPLLGLNYVNQKMEAKFRQTLEKLDYAKVHRNNYNLFKSTKRLAYFQYFYNQITVVIPYIVLYPPYFAAKITFGTLMQCASSLQTIIESLSWFINATNDINRWRSCSKRLKEIGII